MKQTAVDWFFDNLKNHEIQAEHFELYQQAKAMEKEQIMNAIDRGYHEGCKHPEDISFKNAEQYYNETYTNGL